MKVQINLPGRLQKREDELRGTFVSLLNALDEVIQRKRKASFILHFVEERLNKEERRELSQFLKIVIRSFQSKGTEALRSSLSEKSSLAAELLKFCSNFGQEISDSAKNPHQVPKAGTISRAEEVLVKLKGDHFE